MSEFNLYKLSVYWSDFDPKNNDDIKDKELYEISIKNYIQLFNQLPSKDIYIANDNCDSAIIESITFCGISKQIKIFLTW